MAKKNSSKNTDKKSEDKVEKLKKRPNSELKEFAIMFIAGLVIVVIAFLFVGFGGGQEVTEEVLFENTAVEAVVDDLANRLGVDDATIDVKEVQEKTWPDACLGAPRPEEFCAQVTTDGYLIMLEYQDTEFEYHTDEAGGKVRLVR